MSAIHSIVSGVIVFQVEFKSSKSTFQSDLGVRETEIFFDFVIRFVDIFVGCVLSFCVGSVSLVFSVFWVVSVAFVDSLASSFSSV
jgi:hypothetical protein